jgi:DNA-binding SARP family transcriptional activator
MDDAAPQVSVLVLGPLSVASDGRVVPVVGAQQAAVLALLVDRLGDAVSADHLIDEAWAGNPPESVGAALRVHLAKIRALLSTGPANPVQHRADGYRLDPAQVDSDTRRFMRLIDFARAGPDSALAVYDEALGLWRGAPYAGVRELRELRASAERLVQLRLDVEEERIEVVLALGRHDDVCAQIADLVAAEPLRERRTRQLMIALYRSGRQAEALSAYGRLRDELVEELGIDPSPDTRQLEAAILRQESHLALAPVVADAEWATTSVAGLDPSVLAPAGGALLRDLVDRRLGSSRDRVGQRVVELVAVLDDLAYDDVIAAALEISVVECRQAVDRCHEVGILAALEAGEPRVLSRPAWRAGVLARLSADDRADLHERAADALVQSRGVSSAARVVAVRHRIQRARLRGTVDERSGFAIVEGVDASLAAQQVEVAHSLCEDALALASVPDAVVVDLITRQVSALSRLGQVELAAERSLHGIEAARALGDPERLALMVLARDWLLRVVLSDDAERLLLEEALEALGDQPSALRVRVAGALVLESAVPGRLSPVDGLIETVERDARALGDDDALWASLYARHASLRLSPDPERRHRVAQELWQTAERSKSVEWRAWAALAQIFDAFVSGDHRETDRLVNELGTDCVALGSPRLTWHHALMRSARSLDLGDIAGSDQWADEALVIGASIGHPDALGAAAIHAMQVHFHHGTLSEFFPTIEEFAASIPDNIIVHTTRALALAEAGRTDKSRDVLDRLATRLASDAADEFTLLAAAMCAESVVTCADLGGIGWVREILAPFAGQVVVFGQVTATWGPVDRLLGLLAGVQGRHDLALDHLTTAVRLADEAGLGLWQSRCVVDLDAARARARSSRD